MWQKLYEDIGHLGFTPVTVALDSAGVDAAAPWIRAANPTYPCLVDREHLAADLYDMVNVPTAIWIDEDGRIVRPPEPAGTNDAFRAMDHTTFRLPEEAQASIRAVRHDYVEALRDWAENGAKSRFVLPEEEVLRRLNEPNDDHALAALNFRVGEYLFERGRPQAAQAYFETAKRLRPESWSYRRQAWALEDPMKSGGPEFWAAVDALGDTPYYPPVAL